MSLRYFNVADAAYGLGAVAHLLALTAPAPGEHRIYILGNSGHPVPVVVGERRAGDPAQLVASSDRIRADLGWAPKHTGLAGIVRDTWEIAGRS